MNNDSKFLNLSILHEILNEKSKDTENELQMYLTDPKIVLRGFVSTNRTGKSISFLVVRQGTNTIQCCYSKNDIIDDTNMCNILSKKLNLGSASKIDDLHQEDAKSKVHVESTSLNAKTEVFSTSDVDDNFKGMSKAQEKKMKKKMNKLANKKPNKCDPRSVDLNVNNIYSLYTKITPESFVEVTGRLLKVKNAIKSTTLMDLEIQISQIKILSNVSELPFSLKDVFSSTNNDNNSLSAGINVSINKLLDNRSISLRHIPTQSLFYVISTFYSSMTSYLTSKKFIQIKTPKLIESSSEGGANLFNVSFFGRPAFLAQSPQLYKQMSIIGGLQRVFEIGHVYRAEESNINRYLSEFIGVDLEMEVSCLDVLIETVWNFLVNVFNHVKQESANEIKTISEMFNCNVAEYGKTVLAFTFEECRRMLDDELINDNSNNKESFNKYNESGCGRNGCMCDKTGVNSLTDTSNTIYLNNSYETSSKENVCPINKNNINIKEINLNDFSREEERKLGSMIYKKYKTDLFCIKKYPTKVRAFYTKPIHDSLFSESFDFILRGEEILSGAIRISEYDELIDSVKRCGISEESLKGYLDSFKFGVPIHGGCGIGFERTLKQFFGGKDIRLFTMFPRDPSRLFP